MRALRIAILIFSVILTNFQLPAGMRIPVQNRVSAKTPPVTCPMCMSSQCTMPCCRGKKMMCNFCPCAFKSAVATAPVPPQPAFTLFLQTLHSQHPIPFLKEIPHISTDCAWLSPIMAPLVPPPRYRRFFILRL